MANTRREILSAAALSVIAAGPVVARVAPATAGELPPLAAEALHRLGDDAAEWAAAFCGQLRQLGHDVDAELVQWWFANAIEIAHDKRRRHGLTV